MFIPFPCHCYVKWGCVKATQFWLLQKLTAGMENFIVRFQQNPETGVRVPGSSLYGQEDSEGKVWVLSPDLFKNSHRKPARERGRWGKFPSTSAVDGDEFENQEKANVVPE